MKNEGSGNVTGFKFENRSRTQSRTRSPICKSLMIPPIQHKREWMDKAVGTIEPNILFNHGANAPSYTIVIMETNKANLKENVARRVDMLLTKIRREEKPATLADIFVMFVDQTLVPWPLWKVMNSPMKIRLCLHGKPSRKQEAILMPVTNYWKIRGDDD